jgi:hypothetical protein
VADRDDVVSKTFFGRTGKAFLMNNMYDLGVRICSALSAHLLCRFNVRVGPARNRLLMTGIHTIADVQCSQCDFVLGWKYVSEAAHGATRWY